MNDICSQYLMLVVGANMSYVVEVDSQFFKAKICMITDRINNFSIVIN